MARRVWPPLLGIYAALFLSHLPLLRLPYYWDEAGYFIFAGLDFFRHGWLIPRSTLANGHPPLVAIFLAAAWRVAGFHPLVTRAAMLVWATGLVWGVYRLAAPRLGERGAALAALLLAVSPLCFAQATLAQLDLPAAALVIWGLVWRQRGRPWLSAGVFAAAVLTKETAVIAPMALVLLELWRAPGQARVRRVLPLLVPAAVVSLWFVYYHRVTGYWFGNPQFFAYNVGQAAVSPPRIALSLLRRLWQTFGYNGTWLLSGAAGWSWSRGRRGVKPRAATAPPPDWLAVIAVYIAVHAVIGGAILARYLLPALALVFILLAEAVLRLPRAGWWVAGCAGFLVVCWFWNPPYPFPYEDNLAYVQFVKLHQAAARALEAHPPAGAVWTAWPATDELSRPELGYVTRPLAVRELGNFSAASLRAMPHAPALLYLYSREYEPRLDAAALVPIWQRWGDRVFHHAPPAPAAAWLARWGLRPGFRQAKDGQWILLASPDATAAAAR